MKITIINTLYYPYRLGGAEVSVQVLAESLVKRN
ncbi:TPA: glycosyltransferase family 4 protein, partial [Klebsiella pneumoniae]|nr:glycosyltransferase family 4 protein [Klebsiella pneumoniae]